MDIPLPPEMMDPDLSNTSDGTGVATVSSVGLYTNGQYVSHHSGDSPSTKSPSTTSDVLNSTSSNHVADTSLADSTAQSNTSTSAAPSPAPSFGKDPDSGKPVELRKLWKPIRANPSDFTGWTTLLAFVEQQENITYIREAFDGFFSRYPYCYGYWKKYSELEKRFGSGDQSETVLEQGVANVPLSIDLWMYYINFAKDRYKGVAGEGRIRQLFGRAVEAAGLDFKSDDLWDAYIQWEKSIRQLRNVFTIYERLLRIPTLHYLRHFEEVHVSIPGLRASGKVVGSSQTVFRFQQLVVNTPLTDLMAVEELQSLKALVPEGEDADISVRQMIVESRRTIHKQTESETAKRWNFEQSIRRPYFHVKPLEATQLKNWLDYLNFEIEEKQANRVMFLFERCLVACALYEEFWRKYLDYLKAQQQTDYVRYAYQRVCTYHLPNKTGLHLDWASFEEEDDNMLGAVQALQNGLKHLPNKGILALRHIGILRRMQKDPEQIQNTFNQYIQNSEDVGLSEFFLVKEARSYLKLHNSKEKAMELIRGGLKRDPTSNALLTALIDCELQQMPLNMTAITAIFDEILSKDELPQEQKLEFLERKIHHLEDFGADIKEIRVAHSKYYDLSAQVTRGRKRAFGEDDEEYVESAIAKRTYDSTGSAQTLNMSTYAMASLGSTPAIHSWPMPTPTVTTMTASAFPYTATPVWPATYGQAWPSYQAAST